MPNIIIVCPIFKLLLYALYVIGRQVHLKCIRAFFVILRAFLFLLSRQSDEMKWFNLSCMRVTFLNKNFSNSHDDKCEDASIRNPSLAWCFKRHLKTRRNYSILKLERRMEVYIFFSRRKWLLVYCMHSNCILLFLPFLDEVKSSIRS